MNKMIRNFAGILIAGAALGVTGCAVYPAHHHDQGYGPPPHAPAHGYRAKYHDHDLVYDSGLGVYVVIGLPDYYYVDGYYYRHSHDGWYYSKELDRDWNGYDDRKLPPGLAKKYNGGHPGKGKGKDRDKD